MIGKVNYLETGKVKDTNNPSQPTNFDVQVMKFKEIYVSKSGNVTLNFSSTADIAKDHSLVLTFPPEYGTLRVETLKCTLTPIVATG